MGGGASSTAAATGLSDEDLSYYDKLTSRINSALLFIKPHANNEKVQALVSDTLNSKGFTITSHGEITAEDIDSKQLIDNHYYSIASKATLLEPKDLPVPEDKFKEFFGVSYADALAEGSVYNALQASEYLGLGPVELEAAWRRAKAVKFGGGFYAAKIDEDESKKPIYVFNGFFMAMRRDFVMPGTSIHYYVVDWHPKAETETETGGTTWAQFRSEVLGATDPTQAAEGSLRHMLMTRWEELGLPAQPSTGANGVHGSASPLEGLAEKTNWLGISIEEDPFGKSLLALGVPPATIAAWTKDAQIEGLGSIFDHFENTDVDDCYVKAKEINKDSLPPKPPSVTGSTKEGAAAAAPADTTTAEPSATEPVTAATTAQPAPTETAVEPPATAATAAEVAAPATEPAVTAVVETTPTAEPTAAAAVEEAVVAVPA